ncbi:unnamed protein product [Blepharisma stoltei]|uniref:EF-hand domain-containing protein n=1 Tax=Blepharisma stoltei TaxID=1481888 RepID=A0AAU9K4V7_9CILI|nr:unnamed protein product [Blepharisma stoltei]
MAVRKPRVHLTGKSNIDRRFASASPAKIRAALHESKYNYHEEFIPKKTIKEQPFEDPIKSQMSFYATNQKQLKTNFIQTRPKTTVLEAKSFYSRLEPSFVNNAHTKLSNLAKLAYTSNDGNRELEILRKKLSERYTNRKDFMKIFNQWDEKASGIIGVEDLHKMVNKLGFSISFQEAEALMDYAANGNNKTMDFNGFKKFLSEEFQNVKEVKDIDVTAAQVNKMKTQLHGVKKKLNSQFLWIDKSKTDKISYENFADVLSNMRLPRCNQNSIKKLYEELGGAADGINYKEALKKLEEVEINEIPNEYQSNPQTYAQSYENFYNNEFKIHDRQTVPPNQLEKIINRAKIVRDFLKVSFVSQENFKNKLNEIGNNSRISIEKLNELVIGTLDDQSSAKITQKDLEGFLSSFIYNKDKEIGADTVANAVFVNDQIFADEAQKRYRSLPPNRETKSYTEEDKPRLRKILNDLDNKLFSQGPTNLFSIFRTFDKDGDGYITIEDLQVGLKRNKIALENEDSNLLMAFLDENKKGYINFGEFSKHIQPNIVANHYEVFSDSKEKHLNTNQPTKEFLKNQQSTINSFSKAHETMRNSFIPDSTLLPKTRYGASPPHKDTFVNMVPNPSSGMFMSENDRLYSKRMTPMTLSLEDKQIKAMKQEAKVDYIRQAREEIFKLKSENEEKQRMKETMNNLKKSAMKQEYERRLNPDNNF